MASGATPDLHRYRAAFEYYQKATQQPPVEYDYWGNLGEACTWLPGLADTGYTARGHNLRFLLAPWSEPEKASHLAARRRFVPSSVEA